MRPWGNAEHKKLNMALLLLLVAALLALAGVLFVRTKPEAVSPDNHIETTQKLSMTMSRTALFSALNGEESGAALLDAEVSLPGAQEAMGMAGMLPGDMGKQLDAANLDEKQLGRTRAIIQSMTPLERENPSILNASRKKRIAAGCGMQVSDVNRLLKSFEMLQQLTKSISKGRFGGFGGPGGMPTLGKAKKGKLQGFGRKKRLK